MYEDIRQAAIAVSSRIFETMFFVFLEPIDPSQEDPPRTGSFVKDPPGPLFSASILRGEIGFTGRYGGTLGVYLPLEMAQSMAKDFLGVDQGEVLLSQILDMVGELSNMICGNLFSTLDSKTIYHLTLPKASKMSGQEMDRAPERTGLVIDFSADDQRLRVVIQLES